jgi:hypothetical protein
MCKLVSQKRSGGWEFCGSSGSTCTAPCRFSAHFTDLLESVTRQKLWRGSAQTDILCKTATFYFCTSPPDRQTATLCFCTSPPDSHSLFLYITTRQPVSKSPPDRQTATLCLCTSPPDSHSPNHHQTDRQTASHSHQTTQLNVHFLTLLTYVNHLS